MNYCNLIDPKKIDRIRKAVKAAKEGDKREINRIIDEIKSSKQEFERAKNKAETTSQSKPETLTQEEQPASTETSAPQGLSKLDKDLLDAAKKGDLKGVMDAISRGANVNAKDDHGRTALHYASWCGHIEVVKYLVDSGADVNAEDIGQWTPLHYVCVVHADRPEIFDEIYKYLVSKGARMDITLLYG